MGTSARERFQDHRVIRLGAPRTVSEMYGHPLRVPCSNTTYGPFSPLQFESNFVATNAQACAQSLRGWYCEVAIPQALDQGGEAQVGAHPGAEACLELLALVEVIGGIAQID